MRGGHTTGPDPRVNDTRIGPAPYAGTRETWVILRIAALPNAGALADRLFRAFLDARSVDHAIVMASRERTTEYAVLKTIGFSPGHIVGLIGGESLLIAGIGGMLGLVLTCLLYTSDAADERSSVDLGGRRIINTKSTGKLAHQQLHVK